MVWSTSKTVRKAAFPLHRNSLGIDLMPPFMRLVRRLFGPFIPGLVKYVVQILDLSILPYRLVTLSEGLQRVARVRQRHPTTREKVPQERLICEFIVGRPRPFQALNDKLIHLLGGCNNLETSVGNTQSSRGWCALRLSQRGFGVLCSIGAVFGDP